MAQLTSHAHESLQSTPRHELLPRHVTSQSPMPHWTLRQEPAPEHVIAHDAAVLQLTPLEHALFVEHAIEQFQPLGHTIGWFPVQLVSVQSIEHIFEAVLQLVHCDGHAGALSIIGASFLAASINLGASIAPPGTMQ